MSYEKLNRAVELLVKKDFNGLICLGSKGLGKTWNIDKKLTELSINPVILQGDVSEAGFYKFIYENKDNRVIVLRDLGKLLRNHYFIENLKLLTDSKANRGISRVLMKDSETPQEFTFNSQIILELNEISKRYKEDIEALKSRCLVIELNPSIDEIKQIMNTICIEDWQREVTNYIYLKNIDMNLNLRIQNNCFKIYQASVRDQLEWKKQLDMFLELEMSSIKKSLYRFAGVNPVNRKEYLKYLMFSKGISLASAQRRIKEGIELNEIFTDKLKRGLLSINEIC